MLAPILCSICGLPMHYQAGKMPDRPVCDKCKKDLVILEEVRARVNCNNCPVKAQCEEVDRRGL